MAVQEQTPYVEYVANGITTSFELEFDCDNQNHLIVLVDDVEPVVGAWSFSNGAVVFNAAPENGKKITIQRNTPFSRNTDYQSYNNSFRPPAVNKDFDWIWLKLQELGVMDWILGNRIDDLKNYVDDRDDELRAYLLEEIRKQGVALDQLDDYYNYLMQRLAQIAVDKGWDASFVVYKGENLQDVLEHQENLNAAQAERNKDQINARDWGILPTNPPEVNSANWFALNNAFPERPALDIFVPIGTYNFSEGFYITRPHHIRGVGVGELSKVVFDFEGSTPVGTINYKSSIFIVHSTTVEDTSGNGVTLPVGQVGISGTGAVIDFIKVTGSSEHGIIKNAPSYLNGVATMNNAKHGILTVANTGGGRPRISGIANQGSNTDCAALFNGWSGIIEIGDDANVVKNDNCLTAYNEQFGFYDASLLGGTNINSQAHVNTLGDYCMQGSLYDNSGLPETPARTVWISTYAENARAQAYSMNARSLIIGYTGAQPYPHNTNVLSSSVVGMATPKAFSVTEGVQWVQAGKGGDFVSVKKNSLDFGFTANPDASFSLSNLGDSQKIMVIVNGYNAMSFFLQNISTTLQQDRPWFPNGLTMGSYHHQSVGTAAPTGGVWDRGNIVWNENPASGGKIGWVCVAGGSPGVWKVFGSIDA